MNSPQPHTRGAREIGQGTNATEHDPTRDVATVAKRREHAQPKIRDHLFHRHPTDNQRYPQGPDKIVDFVPRPVQIVFEIHPPNVVDVSPKPHCKKLYKKKENVSIVLVILYDQPQTKKKKEGLVCITTTHHVSSLYHFHSGSEPVFVDCNRYTKVHPATDTPRYTLPHPSLTLRSWFANRWCTSISTTWGWYA